jgi:L-fucose isomerase, C-terminal domain
MTRVLMIPTARATFAVDVAAERAAAARKLVEDLGGEVVGPDALVMNDDDVAAAQHFLDDEYDVILHVCASFCDAGPAQQLYANVTSPVVTWAFHEPGPVGDRLWLNSMCGANLIAHALVRDGKQVRLIYGDPGEAGVREAIEGLLEGRYPAAAELPGVQGPAAGDDVADAALKKLSSQAIGAIGDAPTGFTPSQYDADLLERLFGFDIITLDLEAIFDDIEQTPEEQRAKELDAAMEWQPSLSAAGADNLKQFAAVTTSLRDWQQKTGVAALAVRCWPEFPTKLHVCICSSMSRLADEDIATQCERDVYGAATMLLMQALGSGPTYLVDTVDLDAERNIVRFWHCGAAATKLAADPQDATQALHCNRRIGVAGNFALKPGRVVAARLTEDPGTAGLRLLIASGESIPAPNRFQGNTADVVMDTNATAFVSSLVSGGFPHHTVLAWTDIRPGLRAVARHLSIPVIEF